MRTWSFAKGHGTRNDFVILVDRFGMLDLTPEVVAYLCDRRAGVGGDGLLRAVRAGEIDGCDADPETWFMDYRNADGSLAEMCGNGLRVFARFLAEEDLVSSPDVVVATRAGLRTAHLRSDGQVTVGMGAVSTGPYSRVGLGATTYDGVAVDVGNPHVVCQLPSRGDIVAADLTGRLVVDTTLFPHGVNVEVATLVGDRHAAMRVLERGVGETQSCGTGAVAVARVLGGDGPGDVRVDLPGGTVVVSLADDGTATLTGPAVVVARGEVAVPDQLG